MVEAPARRWQSAGELSHAGLEFGTVKCDLSVDERRRLVQASDDRFDVAAGKAAGGHQLADRGAVGEAGQDAADPGEVETPLGPEPGDLVGDVGHRREAI